MEPESSQTPPTFYVQNRLNPVNVLPLCSPKLHLILSSHLPLGLRSYANVHHSHTRLAHHDLPSSRSLYSFSRFLLCRR